MENLNQETEYDRWHNQYTFDDDVESVWHRFIKREINQDNLKGKILLEIGCGRGGLSNYMAGLSQPPAKIFACDYSSDALEIAKVRFASRENIMWQKENIQALSFPDNTFDRIVSCETIEHVPDPAKAVRELYRVLKPGGILYLTCPNYFNFFGLWCVYRSIIGKPYTEGQPYVNYLLLPKLLWWIKLSDFRIISYHTSNVVIPLRAHYHFFEEKTPTLFRWLGFRTYFILEKKKD
jgi:2-polyprenyl-3-methyl-5-hydroxy-6-metoxy-1,4-benzoquinol methylase